MALLYSSFVKGPFVWPGYHDPDQIRIIGIQLRPDAWQANTVYERRHDGDPDYVMPTTYKGLCFKVKYPGKSGATDPFTGTYRAGDEIEDGTCVWEAVNYAYMPVSETISSFAAPTATHDITIATYSNTTTSLTFTIPAISAAAEAAGYFDVTCRAVKSNTESLDITLRFKVAER
jgi:hypothetical protein